jgi:hypothetical protein
MYEALPLYDKKMSKSNKLALEIFRSFYANQLLPTYWLTPLKHLALSCLITLHNPPFFKNCLITILKEQYHSVLGSTENSLSSPLVSPNRPKSTRVNPNKLLG